jgi:energy-coupling factor transport system substrate-specific component
VISAQVSIYPLRQEHLSPAIDALRRAFESRNLHPQVGPMSTLVTGEEREVFAALQDAFATAATVGQVVMTITISNACPI